MAVAYGSGAAALPGTALPSPNEINLDGVAITPVPTPTRR
jgi:1-phosphofructokinase